jgi:hypothetical protein
MCMTGSAPFRDSVVPGPHVSEGITLFACISDSSRNVRSEGTGLTRRLIAEEGPTQTPADRKYMRYFERRQRFPQVGERTLRDVATGLTKAMSSTTSENENCWRVGKGAVDDEGTE